jgi:hypothetical protein
VAQVGVGRGALVEVDHHQDRAAVFARERVQRCERLAHRLRLVAIELPVDELDQRVDHHQRRVPFGNPATELVRVLGDAERGRVVRATHLEERNAAKVGAGGH